MQCEIELVEHSDHMPLPVQTALMAPCNCIAQDKNRAQLGNQLDLCMMLNESGYHV